MHACNEIRHSYEGILKKRIIKINGNKKKKQSKKKREKKIWSKQTPPIKPSPRASNFQYYRQIFFMSSILSIFSFRFMYVCDASLSKMRWIRKNGQVKDVVMDKTTHFTSFLIYYSHTDPVNSFVLLLILFYLVHLLFCFLYDQQNVVYQGIK